jgi:hypothetical protein
MERILVRIDPELSETPGYIFYNNLDGVICYAAKLTLAPIRFEQTWMGGIHFR